jgi:hypothetical protein
MTYSRVDVPEKETFPSTHTTTSISDEIVRGRDLPRAGFDDCLRCAAGGIVFFVLIAATPVGSRDDLSLTAS